jgi:hypothetical protein
VVENAKVTTDVKGFINGSNLLSLKIYCMLEVIDICQKLQILVIALPANATHLFQPLDVAVFRPIKQPIAQQLQQHTMISSAQISKRKVIDIACASYKKSNHGLSTKYCIRIHPNRVVSFILSPNAQKMYEFSKWRDKK